MTAADSPQTLALNSRVDAIDTASGRILCVADIRGKISKLNALAAEHNAKAIIHTGDFGFYEQASVARTTDRTLKHMVNYSNYISDQLKSQLLAPNVSPPQMRQMLTQQGSQQPNGSAQNGSTSTSEFCLSEFPKLLSGELKLSVPVYTVYGAVEDVAIVERLRLATPGPHVPSSGQQQQNSNAATNSEPNWSIPNLTVLSESCSRVLTIGNLRLRLFGLGGACVAHKMFDNGEGQATIAGANGTMWTTMLQIGELVDTAQRVFDPSETRILVTHASPGKEGLLAQLALALKADFTISASLHFRYGAAYNDFSVLSDTEAYRNKFVVAKAAFQEVWDTVKSQVEQVIDDGQRKFLDNALAVTNRIPCEPSAPSGQASEEPALKNTWNWNLPDWNFGSLVLDIREGRISSEMKNQGFNFAYRASVPRGPPSTASGKPQGSANNTKSQNSPNPSAPSTPAPGAAPATAAPPKTQPAPASTTGSAPGQQPVPPQQKPNPHRREASFKDSKGTPAPGSSATQDNKSHDKPVADRENADRPASRTSSGNKRGAYHNKRGSSRTDASLPNTPDTATSDQAPFSASGEQTTRGRGRGSGFRGGRGSGGRGGGRGDFRGGRGGKGDAKDNSTNSSSPAPAPSAAPTPAAADSKPSE